MLRFKKLVLSAALLLISVSAGAQTGKIVGTVTDMATGDPLPGVNVFIEGTTQGTASDLNGRFVIIGVRPGVYTISSSFIGFTTQRKEGVQVNVDLTTTVDFELGEQVIEGDEIVVTAEAITVKKDLTSSEARVTAETIDKLPVTELGQILEVQAGITNRDGIHIRGGRSSEITYMVDGVPVTDRYDGSAAIQLENEGIQELQVVSGTFNAEYGNAMSGVINIVTKEGRSDRFGGSAKVYAGTYAVGGDGGEDFLRGTAVDEFTSAGVQYRDVNVYSYLPFKPGHYYNANVSLEGPILSDRVTFYGLARYFQNDGWFYGARLFNIDGTPGDSSLVPMNTFEKLSLQGNVRIRLTNRIIVNLIGLGSIDTGRSADQGRRWVPDGRQAFDNNGYDFKIKVTHLLSNTTFYTFNVATFYKRAEAALYDDPFDTRYNDFNISPPDSVPTGGLRLLRGGTDLGRFNRTTRSYLAKADLSSQLGEHHLVKIGVQAQLDNLELTGYGLIPATDAQGAPTSGADFRPAIPEESSSSFSSFDGVEPINISAYVQDKIEYENFIVNAGIRMDYFDSRSVIPADPSDPNIFNPLKKENRFRDENGNGFIDTAEERADNQLTIEDREQYWWAEPGSKTTISPRLGVAYPISAQGVIHFSFGLFYQIPTLNNLFDNFGYKIPNSSGQYGPFGNPDLEPQSTTMYEIGFKQGFGEYVLDVTGYYRDVRNWVSTSPVILTVQPGISYVVYSNRDYANTRGVTLSLSRRFTDHWGFDASYTFQVVEGSNSNPADEFFASLGNAQRKLALLPLDWDQRHKIAGGFYLGGNEWGASLRARLQSGFPYDPSFPEAAIVGNDVQPEFAENSRRMPSAWEIDLSAYKEFSLGSVRPRLFIEVFNLFDRRNVQGVFGDTGEPDVTLQAFNPDSYDPGFWVRPGFYSEPRRIQIGVEIRY
ncbi:MAG: TonB-dependent receptor [Rhodothermales bacterium]|nr:TonB-dependent receptor [Rhodothermales bacterium]